MALTDHRKTWHFLVSAPPKACFDAFELAVRKKPGFRVRGIKWDVRHGTVTLNGTGQEVEARIATSAGRAGLAGGMTQLAGARAEAAEQTAVGSELTFAVVDGAGSSGKTECVLWLSSAASILGMTQDGGYFRGYMNDVEKNLQQIDPGLRVSKQ